MNIHKNIGINIKLAFKNIEDSFPEFGIRYNTDNIKTKIIIENKIKIVHHDHCLEKNNIIAYICRECNLKIKNNKAIPMHFLMVKNMIIVLHEKVYVIFSKMMFLKIVLEILVKVSK